MFFPGSIAHVEQIRGTLRLLIWTLREGSIFPTLILDCQLVTKSGYILSEILDLFWQVRVALDGRTISDRKLSWAGQLSAGFRTATYVEQTINIIMDHRHVDLSHLIIIPYTNSLVDVIIRAFSQDLRLVLWLDNIRVAILTV